MRKSWKKNNNFWQAEREKYPQFIYHANAVFKAAQKEFYLLSSPIEGIRLPKVLRKEIQVFTVSEQVRLVKDVRKHMDETFESRSVPGCFAIIFDLFTGLRKGEFLGLEWGDFDFKKGSFRVSRTLQRLPDYGNKQNENKTILEVGSLKTDCSIYAQVLPEFQRESMEKLDELYT